MAKTVFHDLADGADAATKAVDGLTTALAGMGQAAKTAKTTAMDAALGPGGSNNPGGGPGGYQPGYLGPGGGSAGFNPGGGGGSFGGGGGGGDTFAGSHERQGLTPPTQSDPRAAPGQSNSGALHAPGVEGTGIAYDDGHGMPAMASFGVPPTSTVVGVFKNFVFYPGHPFYDTAGGLLSIIGEGNVNLLDWIGIKVGASLSDQFGGLSNGAGGGATPAGSGGSGQIKPWAGGGGNGTPAAPAPPPPAYSGGIGGTVNTNSPDVVRAVEELGKKLDRAFSMGTNVRGDQ